MSINVSMPRLSDTMESGTISRWLKKVGDAVKKGEIIAEVETDKANVEVPSYDEGIIQEITAQEGATVNIGATIAILGDGKTSALSKVPPKEKAPEANSNSVQPNPSMAAQTVNGTGAADPVLTSVSPKPVSVGATQPTENGNGRRLLASPLAKRLATEKGVDLTLLNGSGPAGRILRDDVLNFQPVQPNQGQASAQSLEVTQPINAGQQGGQSAEQTITELSRIRGVIARRMVEAKAVPHFYLTSEIDMGPAKKIRAEWNTALQPEEKISFNDMVIKAVALALLKFPEANGSFRDNKIILHQQVNIGMAVAVKDGLVVPVIRDAHTKRISQISKDARSLAEKARAGKLTPAELEGGTFSISNLGMFDVEDFCAIINPPEAGILAVGTIKQQPVVVDGQVVVGDRMKITLSSDHRILYGAYSAQFVQEIKRLLENPIRLVL